ncbi:hypothetical protein K3495_g7130 [Podosphaera aphanis]|nr:hypothetical protein K3495_g7130 [Podosphaera aphanis]
MCDPINHYSAVNGDNESKMANATHPVIYSGIPTKRKRNLSEQTASSFDYEMHKLKLKKDFSALRSPVSPKEFRLEDLVKEEEPTAHAMDMHLISKTIESQFNLEILLKHNELRLIDQELAKCQIALEQLRRCHLIPYPTSLATPESMLNVSNGTGPIVSHNRIAPQWAPPFGVTDGPYTRHYAKWLIPDPSFDGVPWQPRAEPRPGEVLPEARITRNSTAESAGRTGKSGLRGTVQKLHSLSNGYPQTRDKAGPCILKRSDGQTVKLVCLDCNRGNFSSTQGFINHCRIAHQRDYKSHDEAAVACGQSVAVNEAGKITGDIGGIAGSNGFVHPLIRSAPTGKEAIEACKALLSRVADSKTMLREGRHPGFTSIPTRTPESLNACKTSFIPSALTPHLSDLLNRRGFAGDLSEIVVEAKQQINIEESPLEDDSDEFMQLEFPDNQNCSSNSSSSVPQMRMPARVDASSSVLGQPESAKEIDGKMLKDENSEDFCYPGATSAASGSVKSSDTSILVAHSDQHESINENKLKLELINVPSVNDLCPHIVSSNNAPSLVSDDGEYDEDNIDSGRSEDEVDDSDLAEIDIEEDIVPRSVLSDGSNRGSTARRLRKEQKEKHVTFVSSIKDTGKDRLKHCR